MYHTYFSGASIKIVGNNTIGHNMALRMKLENCAEKPTRDGEGFHFRFHFHFLVVVFRPTNQWIVGQLVNENGVSW